MRRFIFVLLSLFVCACSKPSDKGNEGAGGGDPTAQNAAELASEVYSSVRSTPRLFPEVPLDQLQAAINRVHILIKDHTYANGVETDAANNGYDLIELSKTRWPLIVDHDKRLALLFHELLGLIGLEKNSYAISNRLLSVKNRFADQATYDCDWSGRACQVVMRYDRTLRGFVVNDQGCGQFPQYPMTIYQRLSSSVYSSNANCPEDDTGGEQPCSIKAGGNDWNSITFLDGYEFFFSGVQHGQAQLHCHLNP